MRVKILTAVLLAAVLFAGCSDKKETTSGNGVIADPIPMDTSKSEEPEETEVVETTESVPVASEAVITDRQVVDGMMQSYLTGEWKDEKVAKRRSMAVMVPNNKPALPQYGISKASIIYEAPVEGRVTRLMCFVEDYDDLDRIGPVRSSRDYFVYEAMPYDAIYCNWGLAVPFVEDLLKSDRIDNVSQAVAGIHNPSPGAFDRVDRGKNPSGNNYATEFTGYMFIEGYEAAVEKQGYEKEYRDTFEQAFTFANDGHPAKYEDHDAAELIYPGGKEKNQGGYSNSGAYFKYNEEDGLYYRYQYDGPQIDEMNGEQLAVSNVVFKICHGEVRGATAEEKKKDYLAFGVHGSGGACVFTAGRVIRGTWKRDSDNGPNLFLDEDGNEVIFNQGKTWICNIWEEYSQYISYE